MTTSSGADPGAAAARLLADHDDAWVSALTDELDRQLQTRRIERIMRLWGLSRTELGAMFGISRQAVSKWLTHGVPPERAVVVADVDALTDLLDRYLRRDRIAAVVRRRAPRLGDRSLIELITTGRSSEALELTREMFAFSDVHA